MGADAMKRLIFLFALPYVVTVGSECVNRETVFAERFPFINSCIGYNNTYKVGDIYACGEFNKETCYDIAEALNEARARRGVDAHSHDGLTDAQIVRGCFKLDCNTCCDGACTAMYCGKSEKWRLLQ